MNYEKEIVALMPMLKSYLLKVEKKYNLYDTEDIFQECLCSAIEKSKKDNIENPRDYFIGIFDNTIKAHNRKIISEEKLFKSYWTEETNKLSDPEAYPVINKIDQEVIKIVNEKDRINEAWECMKVFRGDRTRIADYMDLSLISIDKYKNRLKGIYKKVANL